MTAFHYSTHIQPVPDSRPCAITNTYRSREFCKYSLTNAYNYLFTIIKRIDLREEITIIINLIISFNRAKQTTCVIKSDGFTKLPAVLSFFPGFLTEWRGKRGGRHFSLEFAKPAEHLMADSYSIILNQ